MWRVLLFFVFCSVAKHGENRVLVGKPIKIYSTNKPNARFDLGQSNFGAVKDSAADVITINDAVKHQKIVGFGGTFTDATGININKLSKDVRSQVLEALFGDSGIGINLCRVPIGATDFSTRDYTLDDHDGDTELKQFALQNEDLVEKIPIIKEASSLRKGSLKLFASAWTAPIWMKDHKIWMGYSMLSDRYGHLYAEYLKKFLDAYEEKGVKMWGMTTGNSPENGFASWIRDSMGWIPDLQSKWIKEHLGPVIRNSSHKDIKIFGHDGFPETLGFYAPVYVEDEETLKYLDGIATHWYNGNQHPSINEFSRSDKKELLLLAAETSYARFEPSIQNWDKTFRILEKIFTHLEWNYIGWVDYNLVLDSKGGPSHANMRSDSAIMLSEDGKTFTKTPSYYALGHFSKFVVPGSVRIHVNFVSSRPRVYALAFLRPDNVKVVSICNANFGNIKIQLNDGGNYSQAIEIRSHSVYTMLYT